MDRGSSFFSLCVFIYCIFQTTRFSNGEEILCPCPEIPLVYLTETPLATCWKIGQTYRYNCTAGYVRKAGTSNRIKCIEAGDQKGKWTPLGLECIRDPRIKTNPPQIRNQPELLQVSTVSATVTETTDIDTTDIDTTDIDTTDIDTTSAGATTSDPWPGKSNFETEAAPWIPEDHRADLASDPKYIVPSAVALVCVVALVGGICFFWKRRTSTVAQPLPAEQIPMVKEPSESAPASDPSSQ